MLDEQELATLELDSMDLACLIFRRLGGGKVEVNGERDLSEIDRLDIAKQVSNLYRQMVVMKFTKIDQKKDAMTPRSDNPSSAIEGMIRTRDQYRREGKIIQAEEIGETIEKAILSLAREGWRL